MGFREFLDQLQNEGNLILNCLNVCLFGWGRSYFNPFHWAMEFKVGW